MAAGLLCLAAGPAATALAATLDELATFTANVEKAKAHLSMSRELYAAGQAARAALHSSHPVQELGNQVIGPIRQADGALADRMRALLRRPRRAVDAGLPPPQYDALIAEVSAALDGAVARVLPKDLAGSAAFQAKVIARLLDAVMDEYEEAWKGGRITQVVEYEDAYGFLGRVRERFHGLPADVARPAASDLAALARGLPGPTPPASPLSLATVRDLAARISSSLVRAAR